MSTKIQFTGGSLLNADPHTSGHFCMPNHYSCVAARTFQDLDCMSLRLSSLLATHFAFDETGLFILRKNMLLTVPLSL